MQTRLLQKVEELTIYLIELSRQVESLKKENDLLRTQNNSLSEEEQKEKQGLLIKRIIPNSVGNKSRINQP